MNRTAKMLTARSAINTLDKKKIYMAYQASNNFLATFLDRKSPADGRPLNLTRCTDNSTDKLTLTYTH